MEATSDAEWTIYENGDDDNTLHNCDRLETYATMAIEANKFCDSAENSPVRVFCIEYMSSIDRFRDHNLSLLASNLSLSGGLVISVLDMLFGEGLVPSFSKEELIELYKAILNIFISSACGALKDIDKLLDETDFVRSMGVVAERCDLSPTAKAAWAFCAVPMVPEFPKLNQCIGYLIVNAVLRKCRVPLVLTFGHLPAEDKLLLDSIILKRDKIGDILVVSRILCQQLVLEWGKFDTFCSAGVSISAGGTKLSSVHKERDCAICLEDASDLPCDIVTLCCSTSFHIACLDKWLFEGRGRSNCPQCRHDINFPQRSTPDGGPDSSMVEELFEQLLLSAQGPDAGLRAQMGGLFGMPTRNWQARSVRPREVARAESLIPPGVPQPTRRARPPRAARRGPSGDPDSPPPLISDSSSLGSSDEDPASIRLDDSDETAAPFSASLPNSNPRPITRARVAPRQSYSSDSDGPPPDLISDESSDCD